MTPDSIESRLARLEEHFRGEVALLQEKLRELEEDQQRTDVEIDAVRASVDRKLLTLEQALGTRINVHAGNVTRLERRFDQKARDDADDEKARRAARRAALRWYVMAIPALAGVIFTLIELLTKGAM